VRPGGHELAAGDGSRGGLPAHQGRRDDMQVPAVTIMAPVLAILYNCTPGKMPQF
jgi:hypothetical protein